jgi:hypothetical protein
VKYSVLTVIMVVVFACRGSSGDFKEEFTEACIATGDLQKSVCDCLATKAESDLSTDEQQFLLAALRKDEARTTELRANLGLDGAMRAGMFMTNVASCALGQAP